MLPATAQTEKAAKARIAVIFFIGASLVAMRGVYPPSFKVGFPPAAKWYVSAHRVNAGWIVVVNGLPHRDYSDLPQSPAGAISTGSGPPSTLSRPSERAGNGSDFSFFSKVLRQNRCRHWRKARSRSRAAIRASGSGHHQDPTHVSIVKACCRPVLASSCKAVVRGCGPLTLHI